MTGNPWLDWPALAMALVWIGRAIILRIGTARLQCLAGDAPTPPPPAGGWPRVAIVIASKDEAANIEKGVGSLLELDYPDFEVIAVNDRSTDATGELLDGLARRDSRVRAMHLRELPEGWLGKTNALWQGARLTRSPWLLFADADVTFRPQVVQHAVGIALRQDLDFLTLFPDMGARTVWMKAFQSLAVGLAAVLTGQWAPKRLRKWFPMGGAGAFMLVRRDAYDRAGGHEKIKLQVVDDLALGHLLHRSTGKAGMAMAMDWLRVPYAPTLPDLARVSRKNAFAILGYRWSLLLALTAWVLAIDVLAPFCFCVHFRLWPCALVSWIAIWACYAPSSRILRISPFHALLHPILSVILLVPTWRSALAVTLEGGVRWRDSFYPLATLRRGG